ncbi:hypothetical protein CANTEDRAFT_126477 [Yamadazyma tenuis ATCC 10573]|uniref:RhoGAP-domain-containing protein n=1 Tax=Candida tenuis (strain ATCC 10573 / BCRC 21748 / CBS 615 / JCM 9827 / NBRC 10315 / NRRL Y-1498 / VKM Y-70) TaxID=590646 RepID=G3B948_CANTC|nr:uncharacterized protein CANTEDRAFT_126477 [Yamadazyma tenuis ATCC 10573]EGV62460.1 hypothetical protein CANTEDRAFT_126477 [Yamadazyma tenuis ATCC 10573]
MSSPVVPYSQYSQVSPATGYSYRGGLDYESESIRTPITTDFTSHDSIYNIRSSNVMISNNSSYSVNRTMVNEDDGALFIKPEEFQTIALTVISTISNGNTQVQASTSSKRLDDIFITIAVNDRSTGKEMWRIKKSLNQLIAFDNEIRPTVEYFGLPVLPDKSLFFSTTPNKIDVRISGLQNYFNTLFVMPHIPHLILFRICKYLSLDFVNPLDEFKSGSRKEGYLVRKYKGLGTSWKVRWCQVDGPVLELYDQPGGSLLEQINLKHCQIGRQSNDSVAEDKGYRHAFLIMESHKSSKLSNSFPKHFFCAENDYERDEWVNALIDMSLVVDSNSTSTANSIKDDIAGYNVNFQTPRNYGSDYQDEPDYTNKTKSPVPSNVSYQTMDSLEKEKPTDKKGKKRSIFPFRTKGSNPNSSTSQLFDASNLVDSDLSNAIASSPNANSSFTSNSSHQNGTSATVVEDSSIQSYLDKMGLDEQVNKSIFGRELVQAYEISHHNFLGREVPSIIYRCIEFLLKTGAVYEEGIFRLSGSASTIRQLKEAFNKKFDLDLFENELKPDMHTVSGLLKTYLRELPSPIVSDKGYSDLRNIVMNNGNTAATSLKFKDYFNNLNNLDRVYYDTSYIVLKFLKEIINNKDSNKMNLRNVCIVFVPTLNISLDVMSLLLIDFNCIFEDGDPIPDNQREVLDLNIPSF